MSQGQQRVPRVEFRGEGVVGPPPTDQAAVDAALRKKMAWRLTGREDASPEEQLKVVNDLLEIKRLVDIARRKLGG